MEARYLRPQETTSHLPLAISPLSRAGPSYDSPTSREPWQVFIKDLTSKTYTLDAYPYMMVDDLITKMDKKVKGYGFRMPDVRHCRFIFGGKQLETHRMLSDYGIQKGSTIHLVLSLYGGDDGV